MNDIKKEIMEKKATAEACEEVFGNTEEMAMFEAVSRYFSGMCPEVLTADETDVEGFYYGTVYMNADIYYIAFSYKDGEIHLLEMHSMYWDD